MPRFRPWFLVALFGIPSLLFAFYKADPGWLPASYANTLPDSVGATMLTVLSPNLLELSHTNTVPKGGPPETWDFVDPIGVWHSPQMDRIRLTINGAPVTFTGMGFKRRVLYGKFKTYDLRVGNALYWKLDRPVPDGAVVQLDDPEHQLGLTDKRWEAKAAPDRATPLIHVNQTGYGPGWPKKALVGYYLGSLGEWGDLPEPTFTVITADKGATVYTGTLRLRPDKGYEYSPQPYQNVWEADFSTFTRTGAYRLKVPGLGVSPVFRIDEGAAAAFARTYALGLYHQRCGGPNGLPFTRFVHDACHLAPAEIPAIASTLIDDRLDGLSAGGVKGVRRLAALKDSQFPFVRQGTVDVSGGHHDAGDYSKYTIHSAQFIHHLLFAVDTIDGIRSLDNLGLPESGDGVSDLLQTAHLEAVFLSKMQDDDGGFYFLVYPRSRSYESTVLPEHGDPQVVFPKNTAATAAASAALAQMASSPAFRAVYPKEAARYLVQARRGWAFLKAAWLRYGEKGAYQRISHYGDTFEDRDEIAWAAAELFLATGAAEYQDYLLRHFNPADRETTRWGWWRLYEGYGSAIRSYAFAARSGRLPEARLDSAFSRTCKEELIRGAEDQARYADGNAYGFSFPFASKRFRTTGWFLSMDAAFDLVAAYQLDPKPEWFGAMLSNANFEAGANPNDVTYVTGLGAASPIEIVSQYARNDDRVLPPSGIPVSNLREGFEARPPYGKGLSELTFPSDKDQNQPYPFYDRFSDTFNTRTEATIVKQARAIVCYAFLMAKTSLRAQPWRSADARIIGLPYRPSRGVTYPLRLEAPGLNPADAVTVWEASNRQPTRSTGYTFTPDRSGAGWIEAEAVWPDGRRISARVAYEVPWW